VNAYIARFKNNKLIVTHSEIEDKTEYKVYEHVLDSATRFPILVPMSDVKQYDKYLDEFGDHYQEWIIAVFNCWFMQRVK